MPGPRGLAHTVAGILCVLDWTNLGSVPFAIVGSSKQMPSDMYLISRNVILTLSPGVNQEWTIVNYVHLSCNKIKVEIFNFLILLITCHEAVENYSF